MSRRKVVRAQPDDVSLVPVELLPRAGQVGPIIREFAIPVGVPAPDGGARGAIPETLDEAARTVEFVLATDSVIMREDWWTGRAYGEQLDMSAGAVDLTRLKSGRAPVLDGHIGWSMDDVFGTLDKPRFEDRDGGGRQLIARASFPQSDNEEIEVEIKRAWDRLRIGLVRSVSVRFQVRKWEKIEVDGEPTLYIAREWEPLEGSLVPIPADALSFARSHYMSGKNTPTSQPAKGADTPPAAPSAPARTEPAPTAAPADPPPAPVDTAALERQAREQATAAERERVEGINRVADGIAHLRDCSKEAKAAIAAGDSVEDFQRSILEKLSVAQERNETRPQVTVTEDETDKRRTGMEHALLWRAGNHDAIKKHFGVDLDPGEYRNMGLLRMAEECCGIGGLPVRRMNPRDIAGAALGLQNIRASYGNLQFTSDFPVVLENVMHKSVQAAYAMMAHVYARFTKKVNAADFRPHYVYRMGSLTSLDPLGQGGEIRQKEIPDGERGTFQIETWANIIGITRQTIVNDDLGQLMDFAEKLGQALALTKEEKVFELINMNGGQGPNIEVKHLDGTTTTNSLWHTDHFNEAAAGSALTPNGVHADCIAMSEQQDPNRQQYIGLMPSIMLVANEQSNVAELVNTSEYNVWDPYVGGVANSAAAMERRVATNQPNIVRNKFRDVIPTPRLSGNRRYYFADPMMYPVLVFSYLNGVEEPMIESFVSPERDGMLVRIIADFGLSGVDFRGTYSNQGV